jgi:hypothetical protein
MTLYDQLDALDESLFFYVEAQTTEWDRRALLAVHAATAHRHGRFEYLEIGSYLGGSLQVLVRDPRCERILSIDPRPQLSPDLRGPDWTYTDNSKEQMLAGLAEIPGADTAKITTFETGTDQLRTDELPGRPDLCLVDGEHTNVAALRDARFCAAAMDYQGVLLFHDYDIVGDAVREFLREQWHRVTLAIPFTGAVFAIELGSASVLRDPIIDRAISSSWHKVVWRACSAVRLSPVPFLTAWRMTPAVDQAVASVRRRVERARGCATGGS